jgi:hypothetical protein
MPEKHEKHESGSSTRKQMEACDAVPAVRPGRSSGPSNRKVIVSTAVPVTKSTYPAKEKSK